MAIRAGPLADSSLKTRPLFRSYRRVVVAPAYLEESGTPTDPAALAGHDCLGYGEPSPLNRWDIAGADGQAMRIQPVLLADSCETVKCLCLAGQGIACLPDFTVAEDLAAGPAGGTVPCPAAGRGHRL